MEAYCTTEEMAALTDDQRAELEWLEWLDELSAKVKKQAQYMTLYNWERGSQACCMACWKKYAAKLEATGWQGWYSGGTTYCPCLECGKQVNHASK